jgi:hypothetical protein
MIVHHVSPRLARLGLAALLLSCSAACVPQSTRNDDPDWDIEDREDAGREDDAGEVGEDAGGPEEDGGVEEDAGAEDAGVEEDAGAGDTCSGAALEEQPDRDGDGLKDCEEEREGTDPDDPDSDDDGLKDSDEVDVHGTDPNAADSDGDGLSDGAEVFVHGTDPNAADSDGDGLSDAREVDETGTDPNAADSDGDGLSDLDEVDTHGTDPNAADSDGDNLDDADELSFGSDPDVVDTDGDGLDDFDEFTFGSDPNLTDTDGDGLDDLRELELGTDATSTDTDGDGLTDAEELTYGLDPTRFSTNDDGVRDADRPIVQLCSNPPPTPTPHTNAAGDYAFTLAGVASPVDHTGNVVGAATTFTGASGRVAGAVFSSSTRRSLVGLGGVLNTQDVASSHDGFVTVTSMYRVTDAAASGVTQRRDQALFALSGESAATLQPPPAASAANASADWIVRVAEIDRGAAGFVYALAVTPALDFYDGGDGASLTRDATSSASLSRANAAPASARCDSAPPQATAPKVDLYWVLDQSGSMFDDFEDLTDLLNDYTDVLDAIHADWRFGVSNMSQNYGGALRQPAGWHRDSVTFVTEVDEYVVGCGDDFNCSQAEEHGLYSARQGITTMTAAGAPAGVAARADATLGTLFFTDEDDQSIKDRRDPGGATTSAQALLNSYVAFFTANSRVFAALAEGACGFEDPASYRRVAHASGGVVATLCDATTIVDGFREYVLRLTGQAGTAYTLSQTPIPSSIQVYVAGAPVARSQIDGFEYVAETNSIVFFGAAAPDLINAPGNALGDAVTILYTAR